MCDLEAEVKSTDTISEIQIRGSYLRPKKGEIFLSFFCLKTISQVDF